MTPAAARAAKVKTEDVTGRVERKAENAAAETGAAADGPAGNAAKAESESRKPDRINRAARRRNRRVNRVTGAGAEGAARAVKDRRPEFRPEPGRTARQKAKPGANPAKNGPQTAASLAVQTGRPGAPAPAADSAAAAAAAEAPIWAASHSGLNSPSCWM